jgi:hypothetical protein
LRTCEARSTYSLDRILLLVLALFALPGAIRSDEPLTLTIGSRIRATPNEAGAEPVVGRVVALEPGVVVVRAEAGGAESRLPLTPSTTLEVSAGRKSRASWGALLGAAVGTLPGLFMTFGDYNTEKGNPTVVSIAGAAAGAAIGGLVGLGLRSEDWRPAKAPSVTAAIAPLPRGVSVLVRVSWPEGRRWTRANSPRGESR